MDKTTYILGVRGLPGQDGGMIVDSIEKGYSLFALVVSPKSDRLLSSVLASQTKLIVGPSAVT